MLSQGLLLLTKARFGETGSRLDDLAAQRFVHLHAVDQRHLLHCAQNLIAL